MVKEVARITQTPESMAGCLILGITSATIGKGLKLKDHANRVTNPNLYILISADSGTGKTLCAKEIFKPFIDFDQKQSDKWRNERLPELQREKIRLKERLRNTRRGMVGDVPQMEREQVIENIIVETQITIASVEAQINHQPRLYVENVTSEKLAHLLSNQPNEDRKSVV